MVIVKGSFPVRKKVRNEALSLVKRFAEQTRAEANCLAIDVYCQADAPGTIMIWQQWFSSSALEAYFASDAMEDFLDQLTLYLDGEVDTLYFDVQDDQSPLPSYQQSSSCLADDVVLH